MEKLNQQFAELLDARAAKRLPPVDKWHPERTGAIDIRIDSAGQWYHDGSAIKRQPLVDLFATILRIEGGDYYLVTPVEKLKIEVEDVPFIAVDVEIQGAGEDAELLFKTNVGDVVLADEAHPLMLRNTRPYLEVRQGLQAKLTRSVYYRLAELAQQEAGSYWLYSKGARFCLGPASP
jgi:hypothetical protein